jgi:8-oxo-dGTP diphosphatase
MMGERRPILGVSACIWRGERVLLVQRGRPPLQGLWSLPGGHVEFGERLKEAVHRELAEETGVVAEILDLVDIVEVIQEAAGGLASVHFAIACFAGRWLSGEGAPADDAAAIRWADPADFDSAEMTAGTPEIIARARRLLGN